MTPFLSIDPGIEYGWAFWKEPTLAPTETGVFIPEKHPDYFVRSKEVIQSLKQLLVNTGAFEVACEWPSYMPYETGNVAARSGSLVKLAFIVGAVATVCQQQRVKFIPVEVNTWKGQLPKSQVNYHIRRLLGENACAGFRSHAWDAVGIGLHHLGRF